MVRKQPWSVRIKRPFGGWGPYVNISFFDAAAPILGLVGSYMSYLEKIPSEQLTEDNDVKPEITWNTICEQLDKPRFRDTGLRKTRFSLISESLRRDNETR